MASHNGVGASQGASHAPASSSSSSVTPSARVQHLQNILRTFVTTEVLPAEAEYEQYINAQSNRFGSVPPIMEHLKKRAKELGLWNLFLPNDHPEFAKYAIISSTTPAPTPTPTSLLSNAEYAPLAEIMGWSPLASEACNCSAPDTGNMEVLIKYGSTTQQQKWLYPLLAGTIRSAFLMTEPQVASSDARNITTSFTRDEATKSYIVNGRKWWSTGAIHPHCELFIVLGKVTSSSPSSSSSSPHNQHTILLVPRNTPGVRVLRPLTVFGYDDAPEGHAEVDLSNVRVPMSNVVLGEGRGFEISQGRLGPGRVHHCMRAVGLAERCLLAMLQRVTDPARAAFGRELWQHATIQQDIAESRMDIDSARQLVMHTARLIDEKGAKGARKEIALIKIAVPRACLRVVDRSIQAFGGAGVCQDFFLARAWAGLRVLRIVDGPDIVHSRTIALLELKDAQKKYNSSSSGNNNDNSDTAKKVLQGLGGKGKL